MSETSKTIYVKFEGHAKMQKVEYDEGVEQSNEHIIQYVKESYPANLVTNVLIVEK